MSTVTHLQRIPIHFREKIVRLVEDGTSQREIRKKLLEEDAVQISVAAINKFLKRYRATGSFLDVRTKRPHVRILKDEHLQFVDGQLRSDPETTAAELTRLLYSQYGIVVGKTTVKKARSLLGWKSGRPVYCQMVRDVNKVKRLDFAVKCLSDQETFDNCIFTDETTVKISQCTRRRFFKVGEEVPMIPKPKHPIQVHVWAGISRRGATGAYIFTGTMDSGFYQQIRGEKLVPFINSTFPDGHRFVQDNDPKHVSRSTREFMDNHSIRHWATPPESPDMNPIENMWASLKHHISRHVKPRTQQELVQGIKDFWDSVTPYTCNRYIDHLYTVIPKVIEKQGAASGF